MLQFKEEIVAKMAEKFKSERIVSLRDTANEMGINHINAGDCRDIANRLKKIPGARLVRMMNTKYDSLFCSLCIVDTAIEFDNGEEFENDN